jgi:hypothetical protein
LSSWHRLSPHGISIDILHSQIENKSFSSSKGHSIEF